MPTIIDPKTKYAPCPFCGEPGRLITKFYGQDYDMVHFTQIGCVNRECHVMPRTHRIHVFEHRNSGACSKAIFESKRKWETRNNE